MNDTDVRTIDELIDWLATGEVIDAPAEQRAIARAAVSRLAVELQRNSDEAVALRLRWAAMSEESKRLRTESARLRLDSARMRDERNQFREQAGQLQTALNSRIVIEQAKGAIAAQRETSVDIAFEILRKYSRDHNARIHAVAYEVVNRGLRL